MGTPDFALGALRALLEAGHDVVAVVTQPDRPKGRSGRLQMSPVKECALEHGIPVLQPVRIKAPEAVEELRKYPAQLFVVAAFGQILSKEILEMPPLGCINIHASLLPKYRGAAPIQWAILNGERETGVTLMRMDEGMDTGDMLAKTVVPIDKEETGGSLFEKLAAAGAQLLTETLPRLESGEVIGEPQEHDKSTYAGMIGKEMGKIDWQQPAEVLERRVRGLNPWPSAYTMLCGKVLKIWKARLAPDPEGASDVPGTVREVYRDSILVQTKEGCLELLEVQLEGKKRMMARDFLAGFKIVPGERLG